MIDVAHARGADQVRRERDAESGHRAEPPGERRREDREAERRQPEDVLRSDRATDEVVERRPGAPGVAIGIELNEVRERLDPLEMVGVVIRSDSM
jgi:hypothetical protein